MRIDVLLLLVFRDFTARLLVSFVANSMGPRRRAFESHGASALVAMADNVEDIIFLKVAKGAFFRSLSRDGFRSPWLFNSRRRGHPLSQKFSRHANWVLNLIVLQVFWSLTLSD
jgi:hypothetical protein